MGFGKLPEDEGGGEGTIFAEINITPLTDIFLVLLIIFMVSASLMVERVIDSSARSGLKVNLPKGATKEIDPAAKSLVVSVTTGGEIVVQGQKVEVADLGGLFRSSAAKDAQTQVIIEADQQVAHGQVVAIMEAAKAAGLSRLAIAVKGGGK